MKDFFNKELKENFTRVISHARDMDNNILHKHHLIIIAFSSKTASKILYESYKENTQRKISFSEYRKQVIEESWINIENADYSDNIIGTGGEDLDIKCTNSFLKILKESMALSYKNDNKKYIASEDLLAAILQDELEVMPDNCLPLESHFGNNIDYDALKNKISNTILELLAISVETNTEKHRHNKELLSMIENNNAILENCNEDIDLFENNNGEEEVIKEKLPTALVSINKEVKTNPQEKLIGRKEEIELIYKTLRRYKQSNPILVGKSGTGKTAIVEEIARQINNGNAPKHLQGKEILSLNMSQIVAGTRYRGEFEEKLIKAIKFIKNNNEKYLLFIDEAHTIIGSGSSGDSQLDGANILKPYLSSHDIKCIAATTEDEYRVIEKDPAFQRRFKKVHVKETNKDDTREILKGVKSQYEQYHNIEISDKIIETVIELADEYIFGTTSPSKEINILDDLGTLDISDKKRRIKEQDVFDVISGTTGMPVGEMSKDQATLLRNMKKTLNENVYGQEEAIDDIVNVLSSSFVGLTSGNKPLGSFLLAGPTGVGKTEICKQVSKYLNMNIVRFDMSEFQEPHSISKLIGSPPGYVGSEDGGQLVNIMKNNPYSIVLFDEIEKAHPKIMDIFLQMLDEGFITDSKGKKASFKKSIVFMTSNIGASELNKNTIGFNIENKNDKSVDRKTLEKSLKPELLNRFDKIVNFKHIDYTNIIPIVNKHIKELSDKMLKNNNISLNVAKTAVKTLAEIGYDHEYGARPVERAINKTLISPISELIINNKGQIKSISVKTKNKEIVLDVK